jgi:hypothetical protein
MQQQDAAGRINSMAQTADQLAARQKQQADRVRDLIAQQNADRAANRPPKSVSAEEIDKMVSDRQKTSDDLSHLTQELRTAARELAPTQPGASGKLRSALQGMDENDLGNRLQQSSDGLRRGGFSDPLETAMTSDLQKLGEQVKEAARALGSAQGASQDATLNRAMDDLSRLRDQLGSLGGKPGGQPGGRPGSQGQPGRAGQQFQSGQLARNGQPGQGGQPGQQGQDGQPGQQGQQGQGGQGGQAGQGGQGQAGPNGIAAGGGGNRNSPGYGALGVGPLRSGQAVAPQQGPNPADTQRQIEQGLNTLNQVRAAVQDSPEAKQELESLIEQMRKLDTGGFPDKPAMVEQMHQQLVSEVDALELQLRRQLDENQGGTIRNADPSKVPPGYQASVAEYYRKLSTK